jgi:hypothetical protein
MTAEIDGPYEVNYLTVDGFEVPRIQVHTVKNEQDDVTSYSLVLDRRFMLLEIPPSLFHQVAWFVANAMAVAAGYSCHGENCRTVNEYQVKRIGI